MEFVRQIDVVDSDLLWQSVETFISRNLLWDYNQLSVTSVDGENDWTCSAGKIADLKYPQRAYSKCIECFIGSPVEEIIKKYNKFYRWRIMKLDPSKTYSLHRDGDGSNNLNIRLHIPLKTNDQCFLSFFDNKECNNAKFYNLKPNNVYELNTTGYHTAINFSAEPRWHLVGVKYENSNYWS